MCHIPKIALMGWSSPLSTPASTWGTDPGFSDTQNPPHHLAALCWGHSVLGAVLADCLPWGEAKERGERWEKGDRWDRWPGLVLRHVLRVPARYMWDSLRYCWKAWSRAVTMRFQCRAFGDQRPVRSGASVPGPVSILPRSCVHIADTVLWV